jgi:methylated-DNA-[protein]-cysteine S-methyltransferase
MKPLCYTYAGSTLPKLLVLKMIEPMNVATIIGCRTTRIYCRPDCPAGKHARPENLVPFSSPEEARASGYRACKVCKPEGPDVMPETFFLTRYQSPIGTYMLASSLRGVVRVKSENHMMTRLDRWEREGIQIQDGNSHNREVASELDAYFAGNLRQFSVPLDLRGTDFQRQVWQLLQGIPYGETRSYGQIASAIIVPCHRVIGANGELVGYGGGLDRKQALLDLEAKVLRKSKGSVS